MSKLLGRDTSLTNSNSEHKQLAFDIRQLMPRLKNIFPVIFAVSAFAYLRKLFRPRS